MLKSCPYCGRIHAKSYDCGKRPRYGPQKGTKEQRFRSSAAWTRKSIRIRQRDNYLCSVCFGEGKIESTGVEVHHIVPVHEDYDKRLDDDNLISLCRHHHEEAESGRISRKELKELALKAEKRMEGGTMVL